MKKKAGLLALLLAAGAAGVFSQEMEPRAYSPAPIRANVALVSYSYSGGAIFTDPSLPIQDAQANVHMAALAYARTFGLAGRTASLAVILPYAWANASGKFMGEYMEVSRTGAADPRLRFSINLRGCPALTAREFSSLKPGLSLGTSLTVVGPFGHYSSSKLVNIGSNRWAVKPEIGLSYPAGRWHLELSCGVWLFTDNHDFLGEQLREQRPVGSLQAHLGYSFKPGLWLAAAGVFYTGGRTSINGEHKADLQRNSRGGVTLALPLGRRQTLRFSLSTGLWVVKGTDFTTLGVSRQYTWLD
jgi:hypothetical protein